MGRMAAHVMLLRPGYDHCRTLPLPRWVGFCYLPAVSATLGCRGTAIRVPAAVTWRVKLSPSCHAEVALSRSAPPCLCQGPGGAAADREVGATRVNRWLQRTVAAAVAGTIRDDTA